MDKAVRKMSQCVPTNTLQVVLFLGGEGRGSCFVNIKDEEEADSDSPPLVRPEETVAVST